MTASDNAQIQSSDGRVLFLEVHLTEKKKKKFKPTIPITSFLMIYGLPTEQGYATLHAFRCIISASWDLIKITASKILSNENSEKTIPSCRIFPVHLLEKYELICVSMAADKKVHRFCFLLTLQLFSIICHEIIPFRGGKKKTRVKHTAENALDIIIRHDHSWAVMSSHFQ